MLETYVDELPVEVKGRHVLFIGAPERMPDLPEGQSTIIDPVDEHLVERIQQLDYRNFREGAILVVSSRAYARYKRVVDEAQRVFAYIYCKYVFYPATTGSPDMLGVREETPLSFGFSTEINKWRNLPWLLDCPLCDKLLGANIGLPVLLCMPGPSLRKMGHMLPELSRKFLVVTLARGLQYCLENGVEPDFIIQLDSSRRQRHFYPSDHLLKNTYMVSLSIASVHAMASKVRGIFFMDSFDLRILNNDWRIRESWLSSLAPCLGLAEVLQAPKRCWPVLTFAIPAASNDI